MKKPPVLPGPLRKIEKRPPPVGYVQKAMLGAAAAGIGYSVVREGRTPGIPRIPRIERPPVDTLNPTEQVSAHLTHSAAPPPVLHAPSAPAASRETPRPRGAVHLEVHNANGVLVHEANGCNVVTNFVDNEDGLLSGCDIARRRIVGSEVDGAISDASYCPAAIELGTGTAAAQASDTDLEVPLANSRKIFDSVTLVEEETRIIFTVRWSESEANAGIGEAMLRSARDVADGRGDPIARYVFSSVFDKTGDYTFTLAWSWSF